MEKMNIITFAKTGHVLGVVTRASQPETAATVAEVAEGGWRALVSHALQPWQNKSTGSVGSTLGCARMM